MSGNYTKKYSIAGKPFAVKPVNVVNNAVQAAIQSIPGYPHGRKFSEGAFNRILAAIIAEIEKIEKETKPGRDDFGILTSI